jgi:hypothetical protein
MPLLKNKPAGQAVPPAQTAAPAPLAAAAPAAKRLGGTREAGAKAAAPLSKDDYWKNREARDIETGIRIRRSGVWQAALQSTGLLQLNVGNTLQDFLAIVEKAADAGLEYVNRE